MKYIRNDGYDCYYNLALEEYVMTNFRDDDYLLLWQNDNTIVIGRHQNTSIEINPEAVEKYGVHVVRRNTGGGAVYHDMGNLNFSFITDFNDQNDNGYEAFLRPVIKALATLGIEGYKSGRNDLLVGGKKVSGNAQSISNGRILHHGTLLINSDLGMVQNVLHVSKEKIESKGIKSVRSRVCNLVECTDVKLDADVLKKAILDVVFEGGLAEEVVLTEEQKAEILKLRNEKYDTWAWNYGKSPEANFHTSKRFDGGSIEVYLNVERGYIKECKIWGDFLALQPVAEIEKAIAGVQQERSALEKFFSGYDLSKFFGGITLAEIITCFI